jgi:transposase-like protein
MGKRGRRRRFAAADKVAILKRHLVDREEVSAICEELKIHPNQFYEWQRQFFENGVKAFELDEKREEAKLRVENARLTEKLQRKDSVLSELMEDHIALKKSLGEA